MESAHTGDDAQSETALTWDGILGRLNDEIPELVADFMWQLQARDLYATFDVPESDLKQTAAESLALQVRRLRGEPDPPGTVERMRRLAARRLRQGVALAEFLQANSLDFRVLWHRLESIPGIAGSAVLAANLTRVLDAVERYTDDLRNAYLAEEARLDLGSSQQRHKAIQRLFGGDELYGSDIELIADRLGLRPDATFEVIAVLGEMIGQMTARYADDPNVVRYETARSLILLREQDAASGWGSEAIGRGGLVDGIKGLKRVPEAAATAVVIARHADSDAPGFSSDRDVWPRVAYRYLEQTLPRYTRAIVQAIEAESEHDRALIVEATTEYLQTGSVKVTSERLFCHRNTVIKRLRYFAQATGFDPTVPQEAAWIQLALQGSGLAKRVQMHSRP